MEIGRLLSKVLAAPIRLVGYGSVGEGWWNLFKKTDSAWFHVVPLEKHEIKNFHGSGFAFVSISTSMEANFKRAWKNRFT